MSESLRQTSDKPTTPHERINVLGVGISAVNLRQALEIIEAWIRRSGLEWLFRLLSEPGRLWTRYLEYPLFVFLAAAQLAGLSRYPLELDYKHGSYGELNC